MKRCSMILNMIIFLLTLFSFHAAQAIAEDLGKHSFSLDYDDCDQPAPDVQRFSFFEKIWQGNPYHRAYDRFLAEGDEQWLIARFTYGNIAHRHNLKDAAVSIFLLRNCDGPWEFLGKASTSSQPGHYASVDGFEDRGGQVFFKIPEAKQLGIGRHRIVFVVDGDGTETEMFIEILPEGSNIFISDIDGTLTGSELEELFKLIIGNRMPNVRPFAAELFNGLAGLGYRPFYLTARPEFLHKRTREFLRYYNLPAGILRTSFGQTIGLRGESAVEYKTWAMQDLRQRGFNLVYAFGNTASDAEAFYNVGLNPEGSYFYQFNDDVFGGPRIESYSELLCLYDVNEPCNSELVLSAQ